MQSQFPFDSGQIPLGCKKHLKMQGTERMICAVGGQPARRTGLRGGTELGREKPAGLHVDPFSTCTVCKKVLSCAEFTRWAGNKYFKERY